ncbi:MAG TPA: S8 family serine peptidase, partial [Xanthomonadales bacterium]|nr:S8 family serine peptidase [Xanthomonadales bacterium]
MLAPLAAAQELGETITAKSARDADAIGLVAFAKAHDEPLVGVLVELDSPAAFLATRTKALDADAHQRAAVRHHRAVIAAQDAFIARARDAGVPLLLRRRDTEQGKGVHVTVEYRLSYLLDGFIAYVPQSKLAALAALPGVRSVARPAPTRFLLDNSVDYLLGSQSTIAARRLAAYGPTQELVPPGTNGNGPADVAVDGFEGQGINIGVVDSGLDYEHPMFGGSGVSTASPQRPPSAASANDNRKVTYWYNLGGATTLDDFGHGTHVASTAAGYLVDGNTPLVTPTGSAPFGPTPNGVRLHGVAPQARLMGWPVCNAAGNCTGDIELAIEDAVSPVALTGTGDGGAMEFPGPIAKPVADVINLSLGGGNDPASATARVSNSAVLATGVIVVAAAGNDGPEDSTVGAPCVGGLVLCVGSVLDPGSVAVSDVLAAGQVTGDLCADTNGGCATPPPPAETGDASRANTTAAGERVGIRSFRVAGGGELPGGSVSAHFVYVDRSEPTVPSQVTGRIAVLYNGVGAFATIVNPVAALNPTAILLITDTESATALTVVNGVPTFSVSEADGAYLAGILLSTGAAPAHGAVSEQPLRVASSAVLAAFEPGVSGFSSRGPNANDNAVFRTIKPDVAGLGQGVLAATTPTGNTDGLLGMANASGYTIANGTSMATPHVAGAAALVRQRLRTLGLDSTNLSDPDYRAKRFRAQVIARAMLTNTATDLRAGLGAEVGGPNPPYTIQD